MKFTTNSVFLSCILACLIFTIGCQKDQADVSESVIKQELSNAKAKAPKIDICHKGRIINVNANSLQGHLGHGDIQIIDSDGDGFVDQENACGLPVDCDDSDPNSNPDAEEICGDGIDNNCDGQIDEDCLSACGEFIQSIIDEVEQTNKLPDVSTWDSEYIELAECNLIAAKALTMYLYIVTCDGNEIEIYYSNNRNEGSAIYINKPLGQGSYLEIYDKFGFGYDLSNGCDLLEDMRNNPDVFQNCTIPNHVFCP